MSGIRTNCCLMLALYTWLFDQSWEGNQWQSIALYSLALAYYVASYVLYVNASKSTLASACNP